MTFARQSLGSLAALVFGVVVSILLPRILGPEARRIPAGSQAGGPRAGRGPVGHTRSPAAGDGRGSRQNRRADRNLARPRAGRGGADRPLLGIAAPLFKDNLLRGVDPLLLWLTLGGSVASLVGLLARRFIQLGGRLDVYNGLDVGRNVLFLLLVLVGGACCRARRSAPPPPG